MEELILRCPYFAIFADVIGILVTELETFGELFMLKWSSLSKGYLHDKADD